MARRDPFLFPAVQLSAWYAALGWSLWRILAPSASAGADACFASLDHGLLTRMLGRLASPVLESSTSLVLAGALAGLLLFGKHRPTRTLVSSSLILLLLAAEGHDVRFSLTGGVSVDSWDEHVERSAQGHVACLRTHPDEDAVLLAVRFPSGTTASVALEAAPAPDAPRAGGLWWIAADPVVVVASTAGRPLAAFQASALGRLERFPWGAGAREYLAALAADAAPPDDAEARRLCDVIRAVRTAPPAPRGAAPDDAVAAAVQAIEQRVAGLARVDLPDDHPCAAIEAPEAGPETGVPAVPPVAPPPGP